MQEFKHSVKVPRNYKLAATILKKTLIEGASAKTLVFQDKLRHFRTNVLYALVSEAIKHNGEIDRLFEFTNILKNEPRLDPWLAKILTVELLFGKQGLPGRSKPELTVASYKEQFEKYSAENPDQITKKGVRRPRYVRINTNLLTTSDAIRAFQDEGYRFVRCTSGSYDDYLEQVLRLEQYDFLQDYHVKTVFVFAPGTKLHEHDLYYENKIILQDKATSMVAQLLAPPPGGVVMDMCAAPGMKTTHLAAFMKNQGKIYAVERSEERYETLCNFVKKTGSTCVETINKDVLDVNRNDYPDVEYVLLDPSCSGSGMELNAHTTHYMEDARLARLTSLQEKFLKHAMNAFPKVKRIVYSTCSLFPQENERVVTNAVNQCRDHWNVLNVKELLKDQWNNFGTGMYGSIGLRCMYARPESDLTTGFFLAVMEKGPKCLVNSEEQDAENNIISNDEAGQSNKKPNKKKSLECVLVNQDENETQRNIELDECSIVENEEIDHPKKNPKKEKKKIKKANEETITNDDTQSKSLEVTEQAENVLELDECSIVENEETDHQKKKPKKEKKKIKKANEETLTNDDKQSKSLDVTEQAENILELDECSIVENEETDHQKKNPKKEKKKIKKANEETLTNDDKQSKSLDVTEQAEYIPELDECSIVENEETDHPKKKPKKEKNKIKKANEATLTNDDNQSKNLDVTEQAEIIQDEMNETEQNREKGDKTVKKNKKANEENVVVPVNDSIDVIAKRKKNKNKEKHNEEEGLQIKGNKTPFKEDDASKKRGKKRNREIERDILLSHKHRTFGGKADLGQIIDLEAADNKDYAEPKKKKNGKGNRELV